MQNAFNISLIPPILTFAPSFPDVKNSQETICIEKLLQISALFMLSQIYNGLQAVKSIKIKGEIKSTIPCVCFFMKLKRLVSSIHRILSEFKQCTISSSDILKPGFH